MTEPIRGGFKIGAYYPGREPAGESLYRQTQDFLTFIITYQNPEDHPDILRNLSKELTTLMFIANAARNREPDSIIGKEEELEIVKELNELKRNFEGSGLPLIELEKKVLEICERTLNPKAKITAQLLEIEYNLAISPPDGRVAMQADEVEKLINPILDKLGSLSSLEVGNLRRRVTQLVKSSEEGDNISFIIDTLKRLPKTAL